jgi:hypothetical protein
MAPPLPDKDTPGEYQPQQAEPLAELIINVEEYCAGIPQDVPWACRPFAYGGGVSLLSGSPKIGKGTLLKDLAASRETGEPFCGWPVKPGPTLLVTEEGGIAVAHKVAGLRQLAIMDRRHALAAHLDWPATLDAVERWSAEHPDGLAILDTLAVWAGIKDENDSAAMTDALAAVTALAQRSGLAVIVVHHTRKGGGEHGEAIRGSSAALATVDLSLELKRTSDGYDDERYLDVLARILLPERYRLGFDRETLSYFRVDLEQRAEAEVSQALAGIPADGPGLSRDDLRNLWGRDPRRQIEHYRAAGKLRSEVHAEGRTRSLRYWRVNETAVWDGA